MKSHKKIFSAILKSMNNEPDADIVNFTSAQIDWHTVRLHQMGYIERSTPQDDSTTMVSYTITPDGLKALTLLQQNVNPF